MFLDMRPINRPEVMVTFAAQKFDQQGNLIDGKAKDLIKQLMIALVNWTGKLKAAPDK